MPQPANPTNLPEGARPKPNAGNPPVAFGQGADKQQHREGPRATAQPALARNERPQEPATKADRAVTSLSGAKPGLTSLDNAYVKVDGALSLPVLLDFGVFANFLLSCFIISWLARFESSTG